jgi:hypothetical protein
VKIVDVAADTTLANLFYFFSKIVVVYCHNILQYEKILFHLFLFTPGSSIHRFNIFLKLVASLHLAMDANGSKLMMTT